MQVIESPTNIHFTDEDFLVFLEILPKGQLWLSCKTLLDIGYMKLFPGEQTYYSMMILLTVNYYSVTVLIYVKHLTKMPLYLNDTNYIIRAAAEWRLKIGK